MSDGPDPGRVIVGVFLVVFGTCFALVGGGCTLFLLVNITDWGRETEIIIPLLILSLVGLAIGILMLRGAMKLFRGRND
jgi:phosphate/sulfate permease